MTIGSLPPPGSNRELAGRQAPPDRHSADSDGFALALQAITASDMRMRGTAERFNEHGFFADTANPVGPGTATPAENPDQQGPKTGAMNAVIAPADPAALAEARIAETESLPMSAPEATPVIGGRATGSRPLAARRASETKVPESTSPALERPITGLIDTEISVSPARAAKPRLPSADAAKSPVSVVLNARDGAVAVTVSAQRLTDRDVDALRTDIAALLRRHGLVLDDLKLNGLPMGRGMHDRSGD